MGRSQWAPPLGACRAEGPLGTATGESGWGGGPAVSSHTRRGRNLVHASQDSRGRTVSPVGPLLSEGFPQLGGSSPRVQTTPSALREQWGFHTASMQPQQHHAGSVFPFSPPPILPLPESCLAFRCPLRQSSSRKPSWDALPLPEQQPRFHLTPSLRDWFTADLLHQPLGPETPTV